MTANRPGHLSPLLKQATRVEVERGEGCYLYAKDGQRYLDFTAGIGVTSTGHCHPKVVAAAQEQVGKLIHGQYTTIMHQPIQDLSARLGRRCQAISTRCSMPVPVPRRPSRPCA